MSWEQFAEAAVAAGRYRDVFECGHARCAVAVSGRRGSALTARRPMIKGPLQGSESPTEIHYLTGDEVAERVRATIARKASAAA